MTNYQSGDDGHNRQKAGSKNTDTAAPYTDQRLPLVSLVTPSYNQDHFIRETIESVLNQDYPNIEYWVIDGRSTDNTVAILREYESDPRFHWLSERDKGQADAINKGWQRSTGTILCWLNSDDYFASNDAIRSQIQVLIDDPAVGLIYGDGIYVDEQGNPLSYYATRDYSYSDLLLMNYIMQPTVFIKREVVEQVGWLDESFRFAMDRDYWLRCSAITTLRYNPVLIATYRLHGDSKTVESNIPLNIEGFGATYKHFADHRGNTLPRKQRQRVLASSLLILAVRALRAGESSLAIRCIRGAWRLNRTDPRYVSVLLAFIDQRFGWQIQPLIAGVVFFIANPRMRHKQLIDNR